MACQGVDPPKDYMTRHSDEGLMARFKTLVDFADEAKIDWRTSSDDDESVIDIPMYRVDKRLAWKNRRKRMNRRMRRIIAESEAAMIEAAIRDAERERKRPGFVPPPPIPKRRKFPLKRKPIQQQSGLGSVDFPEVPGRAPARTVPHSAAPDRRLTRVPEEQRIPVRLLMIERNNGRYHLPVQYEGGVVSLDFSCKNIERYMGVWHVNAAYLDVMRISYQLLKGVDHVLGVLTGCLDTDELKQEAASIICGHIWHMDKAAIDRPNEVVLDGLMAFLDLNTEFPPGVIEDICDRARSGIPARMLSNKMARRVRHAILSDSRIQQQAGTPPSGGREYFVSRRYTREEIQRRIAAEKKAKAERAGKTQKELERERYRQRKQSRQAKVEQQAGFNLRWLVNGSGAIINGVKNTVTGTVDCVKGLHAMARVSSRVSSVVSSPEFTGMAGEAIGKVIQAGENFASASEKVATAADSASDFVSSVKQFLQAAYDSIKRAAGPVIASLLIVVALYYMKQISFAATPIVMLACWAAIEGMFSKPLRQYLSKFFQAARDIVVRRDDNSELPEEINFNGVESFPVEEPIEQQSGFDALPQLVGTVLVGLMASGHESKYIDKNLINATVRAVSQLPRVFSGLETLLQVTMAMAERGINFLLTWADLAPIRLASKWSGYVEEVLNEVDNIDKFETIISPPQKDAPERMLRLKALYAKVYDLKTKFHSDRELNLEFARAIAKLQKRIDNLSHVLGEGAGYRPQPASVVLAGKPGVGKTAMTQVIAVTILKLAGKLSANATPEESSRAVFCKPFNTEYMDGYHGQLAYVIDDLGAKLCVPGEEGGALMDVMTYYSSFKTLLNMAACDQKGRFPFSSCLMLMSTNMKNLKQINGDQILLDTTAFNRRIDIHVEVCVRPEYRVEGSHQLDIHKFDREAALCKIKAEHAAMTGEPFSLLDAYPWHIWEVFERSFLVEPAEPVPGTGKPLLDVIKQAAEKIIMNDVIHRNTMDNVDLVCKAGMPADYDPKAEVMRRMGIQQQSGLGWSWLTWGLPDPELPPLEMSMLTQDPKERTRIINMYFNRLQARRSWFVTNFKLLLPIAAIAVILPLVPTFYRMIKGAFNTIIELITGKRDVMDEVESQSNMPKSRLVKYRIQSQAMGSVSVLWELILANTYKTGIWVGDGTFQVLGQITILKDTDFVMPNHFDIEIKKFISMGVCKPDNLVEFRSCSKDSSTFTMKLSEFMALPRHRMENRDLVFGSFGRVIQKRRNIMKFIVLERDFKSIGGQAVRLDVARIDANGRMIDYYERESFMSPTVEVGKTEKRIGSTFHKHWLRYYAATVVGDCGAPLTLQDHSGFGCRLLLGIHVGCQTSISEAYATRLSQEIVEEGLKGLPTNAWSICSKELTFDETQQQSGLGHLGIESRETSELPFTTDGEHFGSFTPLIELSKGVSSPIRSNLVPTLHYEEETFKEDLLVYYGKEPEKLVRMALGVYKDAEGQVRFPMAEALAPFATDPFIPSVELFKQAVPVALKPFNDATLGVDGRLLDYREAVLGCPPLKLKSIPRGTSVGYPCCVFAKDKSYFFGKDDLQYDLDRPEAKELEEQVSKLEECIREGIRPFFVCRGFLKDEVRKEGKVARYIAGTDVRYYILCRRYFGAYVAAQMRHYRNSGICIGMNPYQDWGWLREWIQKRGSFYWDGDFSGFDSMQPAALLWVLCDEICEWYAQRGGAADNDARRILFIDLVFSRHLVSASGVATKVIQWSKSLPSGHFLTSTVNSMLSMSCVVSAFIGATGEVDFWSKASAATLGDDNIVSADETVIEKFNQVTVARHLKDTYGMVYTAGRKGEELKPHVPFETLTFLQRSFRFKNLDGVKHDVCPLRPESFLLSLYFTKRGDEKYRRDVLLAGYENALEELSMHEDSFWDLVAPKLAEAKKRLGEAPALPISSSEAYLKRVLTRVPDY